MQLGLADVDHFKQLMTGFMGDVSIPNNPPFIDKLAWGQMQKTIYGLKQLKGFEGFNEYFIENVEKFRAIYDAEDPKTVAFPGVWQEALDPFKKLLV